MTEPADAQHAPPGGAPSGAPVTLPRSLCWDVHPPQAPERTLRVMLAWPEQPPPDEGYPLLAVLDATTVFGTAVEAARLQANRPGATGVQPGVVLGLGYLGDREALTAARRRDYTPPPEDRAAGTGEADAFLRTLLDQVLPAVERLVPLDRTRTALFGHSLGGLLVLHALMTRPAAFARHVAASPSLWWGDRILLRRAQEFAARPPPLSGQRLLLTVGGLERPAAAQAAGDAKRAARQEQARMVESVHELAACLAPVLDVRCVEFADENHGSVLPAAISRAIPFALGQPSLSEIAA